MNKKRKPIRNLPFVILFIGITFYVLLRDKGTSDIVSYLKNADLKFIIVGVLLAFTFVACEGLNSYTLLNYLGVKTPYYRGVKYAIVGFFYSAITPSSTGGQPMQMFYMSKDKVPLSASTITMIIELISYQTVTFVLASFAFLFKYNFIVDKISFIIPFMIFGVVINVIVVAFFIVVLFSEPLAIKIVDSILRFLHKIKIIKNIDEVEEKANKQIDQYKEGITLLKSNPLLLLKVFLTTMVQLTAMYSIVFVVYKAFNQSGTSYFNVLSLQSIFKISMGSLPLPGAIGISEGGFLQVFKHIFPQNMMTPAMLVSRGISFYLLLLATGTVLLVSHTVAGIKDAKSNRKEAIKQKKPSKEIGIKKREDFKGNIKDMV